MQRAGWLVMACALGAGCKGDPIYPPGSGTTAGTPSGPSEGDCTDGVDGDNDGLLDCEDDDCAGEAACTETDCLNGADDDADGYFDCADADCWGHGCAVTQARITSSGRVTWKEAALDFTPTNGCAAYHLDTATMTLESPTGLVRYLSPEGGDAWVECNWSAARSVVFDVNTSSPFSTPRLVLREGFTVDPDCPVFVDNNADGQPEPLFLPLLVTLDIGDAERAMRTGPAGAGPPWWGMTGAPTPYDSTAVSGPVHSANSCNFNVTGLRSTVSWGTPDIGFDFFLAGGVNSSSTTP